MDNTGIGNQYSSTMEHSVNEEAKENFAKRAEKLGSWPGTHTLGAEFRTVSSLPQTEKVLDDNS